MELSQLIDNLNSICQKLKACRLTKKYSNISEYILFSALNYCNLEIACNELGVIISKLSKEFKETDHL